MKSSAAAFLLILLLETGFTSGQTSNPAMLRGAFVDVDGSQLYYEECGSGPESVVLLHDGVVNSAVWDGVWPAFCQRFHAIRYDRRGYGRSPATKKPYYEADDLAALLHDRKISHGAIVASSHGGEVALNFSLRYAAFVSELVLVGPVATGFPYSEHFLMRERANAQSDKVQDLMDAAVRDPFLIVPSHDAAISVSGLTVIKASFQLQSRDQRMREKRAESFNRLGWACLS
jgi:3-oxoadipate enol-lactonase